ncbi:hypothetical protein QFC21_006473 [Naganishia friedmannii]|uniref:Uncharacterized protein n=1 Tax=Naganishia friedmannii TaxID=89922 RepID=A0ACC2V1P8_9TREE|nr:hypothetical protein QFC21_006473 [Naganishia friedmannii]
MIQVYAFVRNGCRIAPEVSYLNYAREISALRQLRNLQNNVEQLSEPRKARAAANDMRFALEFELSDQNPPDTGDDALWDDIAVWTGTQDQQPAEDTVALIIEIYPRAFDALPTNHQKQRQSWWEKVAEEEAGLAAELLSYQSGKTLLQDPEWLPGEHSITLINKNFYGNVSRQAWTQALCDYLNDSSSDTFSRSDTPRNDADISTSDSGQSTPPSIVTQEKEATSSLKEDIIGAKCPCCLYQLADEQPRTHGLMFTIDGNFSWKRLQRHGQVEYREFNDVSLRIPPDIVNRYEETPRRRNVSVQEHHDEESTERCSESQRMHQKTIVKGINETGIVALVCRHNVVWKYVDMIQSGESAKYAKCLIHWLIENGLGEKAVVGYDTGCTLGSIMKNSEIMSTAVSACKMTFGNLIRSNVRHAMKLLKAGEEGLSALRRMTGDHGQKLDDNDIEGHRMQEREFLAKAASLESTLASRRIDARISYMKGLQTIQDLQTQLDGVNRKMAEIAATRNSQGQPRTPPHLLRAQEDKRVAIVMENRKLSTLAVLGNIDPEDDWSPRGVLWEETALDERKRAHKLALKEVEKECIKQLFEMDKMGFAGTAYRFRKEIMTATRNRSKSLKDLIDKCNTAGKAAGRTDKLEWMDVTDDATPVSLLTILRSMDPDELLSRPWTHKVTRDAVRYKMQIDRATEELELLAVEWQRLRVWVNDREEALIHVIDREREKGTIEVMSHSEQPSIVFALASRLSEVKRNHRRILWSLEKCKSDLIRCGTLNKTLIIPKRSLDLQHLPEMNTFNRSIVNRSLIAGARFPTPMLPTIRAFNHGIGNATDRSTRPSEEEIEAENEEEMEEDMERNVEDNEGGALLELLESLRYSTD